MTALPPAPTLFPYPTLFRSLLPRPAHAHIPQAPAGAGARDKAVWDHLSDQPHQHAGRLDKLRVRLGEDRKSTRLNSSHSQTSYAVFCLKKKRYTTPAKN